MRSLMMLAAAGSLLAACGAREEDHESVAPSSYSPPTVTSRMDFGGEIERRFHRADVNGDDRVTADELPERLRPMIARGDTDKDGALGPQEWGDLLLNWFDRNDLNQDGTLTSEERETYSERRRAASQPQPDEAAR